MTTSRFRSIRSVVASSCLVFGLAPISSATATLYSTRISFPDGYPITSGFSSGLPSISLGTSFSGGERIDLTFYREGSRIDTAFIGSARGGIAVSPFRFERQGGDIIVNFSRPIDTFGVRMGDFGADSPDLLSLRAYPSLNGVGPVIASRTASLPTEPPGTGQWNQRRLSVSASGIQSVRMIGGTSQFPHSVFYNEFLTSFNVPSVAETRITKAALAASNVNDILNGEAATATGLAVSSFKTLGPVCSLGGPKGIAACGAIAATVGVAAFLNGLAIHDIGEILRDPPRFDYGQLADLRAPKFTAPPGIDGLSEKERGQIIDLLSGFAESRHLYAAWLMTLERLQGAEIARDSVAVDRQFSHLEKIILSASALTARNGAALRYWGERLDAELGPLSVTEAEAREISYDIKQNGLPEYLIAMLASFGYDERARGLIEDAMRSAEAQPHIGVDANIASAISWLEELLKNIACVTDGCFVDHRFVSIPDGKFELSFDYANLGEKSLASLFINGEFFGDVDFFPSNESALNTRSFKLESEAFLIPSISVSFFVNGSNPIFIDNIFTREILGDVATAVSLPSSIALLGMALVFFFNFTPPPIVRKKI